MPWGWALAAVSLVGTGISVSGQMQAADAARAAAASNKVAADYQAHNMEVKAGQDRATSQRNLIESRRRQSIVMSRERALSADSGAGASDPTIITNEGKIGTEGEINALNALYKGEESARGLEEGATLTRYQGVAGVSAGNARADAMETGAFGSAVSGIASAGSMYARYGNGGPTSTPNYRGQNLSQPDFSAGYY